MTLINKNNEEMKKTSYDKKKYLLLSLLSLGIIAKAISNNNSEINLSDNNCEIESSLLTGAGVFGDEDLFYVAGAMAHINQTIYVEDESKQEDIEEDVFIEDEIEDEDVIVKEPEVEEEVSTPTDKVYYNFPCSQDLQDHIIRVAEHYGYPYELSFIIIDQETDGNWHLNGYISPTNDYGLTQINICNMEDIERILGITKEEILYDEYKAIEAHGYIISTIFDEYGYTDRSDIDYKNIFGAYNGWLNWQDKEKCWRYVNRCMERLEEKFGITEEDIKNKTLNFPTPR